MGDEVLIPAKTSLIRGGFRVILLVLLLMSARTVPAQSSVEKSETSQQSRAGESELERAKAIVARPKDNKPVKPETGRVWGPYSTTSSIEVGYRFVDTDGSLDRYLSDVNVRDGFRLLEYSLDMRAQPGTGIAFDFLKAEVQNAGGDRSQNFSLRMDKTRVYRFDASVRRFNYYNALGPNFALGLRTHDLRQQISDFGLKLFVHPNVRVNLGYARTMAKGRYTPSYYWNSDFFALPSESRWSADDYRAGLDANYKGWTFVAEQLYRHFKTDPDIMSKPGVDQGLNLPPPPVTSLSFLERDTPLRARSLVTRGSAQGSIGESLHLVFRGLHDDELMQAPYFETATGRNNSNQAVNPRMFTSFGATDRPGATFDAGATYDINDHYSISNVYRYTSFKIVGDVRTNLRTTTQAGTNPPTTSNSFTIGNTFTEWKSHWNTLSLDVNYGKRFSANLGWRFMNRDITLQSRVNSNGTITASDEAESVNTNAFIGGARYRPIDNLSFMFDVESGTANNAFVRINPLDYTRVRARAQYRITDKVAVNGVFTSLDRNNPTPQVENESDSRSYTASVSWNPNSRAAIDVGYDYHHLFATANIRYFIASVERRGDSMYFARINTFWTNFRLGLTNRLDLLGVYYYIMDRGAPSVTLGPNDIVSSYPLHRHNPEVRLAYRFNNYVTGNLSYRHFSYNEIDFNVQDYRANILTTSVRFTF